LVEPDAPELLTPVVAAEILGGTAGAQSLAHTLSSLESKGVLRRVGKGVYLNVSTSRTPKVVDVIPWIFRPSRFYLGLNAMANHWGLSPQIPRSYHVVYAPKDEAQIKKIARWCKMLDRFEEVLGGSLTPLHVRAGSALESGVSQTILEGVQLPVSTVERTIVDAVVYTNEIGGAGEALLWAKSALGKDVQFDELDRIVGEIYEKVNSVAARLGFLFEFALGEGRLHHEQRKEAVETFLTRLESMVAGTRATYNWGNEEERTQYFQRWHLRVSSGYLGELKEVSAIE
jgi:predicted transcriptional regulator of viral defense system